jgi:hypothetical protein
MLLATTRALFTSPVRETIRANAAPTFRARWKSRTMLRDGLVRNRPETAILSLSKVEISISTASPAALGSNTQRPFSCIDWGHSHA